MTSVRQRLNNMKKAGERQETASPAITPASTQAQVAGTVQQRLARMAQSGSRRQSERAPEPAFTASSSLLQPSAGGEGFQRSGKMGGAAGVKGTKMEPFTFQGRRDSPAAPSAAAFPKEEGHKRSENMGKGLETSKALKQAGLMWVADNGADQEEALKAQIAQAEQAQKAARVGVTGAQTQAELMEWQKKLKAATEELERYTAAYNDLGRQE